MPDRVGVGCWLSGFRTEDARLPDGRLVIWVV